MHPRPLQRSAVPPAMLSPLVQDMSSETLSAPGSLNPVVKIVIPLFHALWPHSVNALTSHNFIVPAESTAFAGVFPETAANMEALAHHRAGAEDVRPAGHTAPRTGAVLKASTLRGRLWGEVFLNNVILRRGRLIKPARPKKLKPTSSSGILWLIRYSIRTKKGTRNQKCASDQNRTALRQTPSCELPGMQPCPAEHEETKAWQAASAAMLLLHLWTKYLEHPSPYPPAMASLT